MTNKKASTTGNNLADLLSKIQDETLRQQIEAELAAHPNAGLTVVDTNDQPSLQVLIKATTTSTVPAKYLNKIVEGDSLASMREMPDGCIDLWVTSPPYNLKNSTGNGMKDGRGGKWSGARLIEGYATHNDNMPHDEYVAWQRDCLREMLRLLAPKGAIFYNHKWRVQGGLLQDRSDILDGFPVRQIIIWRRAGGINFNKGYFLPTYEVIYLIAKPGFALSPKANALGDVWEIKQEMKNPHPAPFPVELVERIISSTTAQVVGDPFMGSGTTAIGALNLGRSFVGLELAPEYAEMARTRVANRKRLLARQAADNE